MKLKFFKGGGADFFVRVRADGQIQRLELDYYFS